MKITVEAVLLVMSILFFVSILAGKAGYKLGVPVLLLFLTVGMLSGTDGLGIEFENFYIAQTIGTVALCIILFSGEDQDVQSQTNRCHRIMLLPPGYF